MNILAVDTSSSTLIAAIDANGYKEELVVDNNGLQHSETLMPYILNLCEKAKITTKELELLICTRGPGSFTGLRIAMATLKGIAYGSNSNLVSVSTMQSYANTVKNFDGLVITAIDAKKQRYYLACFECKDGKVIRLMDDIDGNVENLDACISKYKKILVVGPDKENFAGIIKEHYSDKEVLTETSDNISFACSLIELGQAQYKEKGADDIGQGPAYLRKSDAEVALEEKKESNNG